MGALVVLVAALLGVPAALVWIGAPLLPADLGWSELVNRLTRPDDGSVVLGLITLVGWVAWAVFAVSVLAELLAVVSRSRFHVGLPGLGGPQRVAGALIAAVLALSVAPALPVAAPMAPVAQAAPAAQVAPAAQPAAQPVRGPSTRTEAAPSSPRSVVASRPSATHVVAAGDDLWSLAERYYGDGRAWRRIAAANPHLLSGGPDRLTVGWRLAVPDVEQVDERAAPGTVTVRRGQSLSDIAAQELGSAKRWPELYRANRATLADPDELVPGMRLALPHARAERQADPDRDVSPSPSPDRDRPTPRPARAPTSAPPTSETSPPPADPTQPAPTRPAPTLAAPTVRADAPTAESPAEELSESRVVLPLAGVGGLLAAGLVAGLVRRRRLQLQARPLGRRIAQPPVATGPVAAVLGRVQRPLTLRSLDLALRAIGASRRSPGSELPPLQLILVSEDQIELVLAREQADPPLPFRNEGRSWLLESGDADYLRSVPGLDEALRPWPSLVTLGRTEDGRQVLVDLEALGLLQVQGDGGDAAAVLAAMAVELSFSPWAEEMRLTVLGAAAGLPDALGVHTVTQETDVDALLDRLDRRAAEQRRQQPTGARAEHRLDPDLADPWAPEIVLVAADLDENQRDRLEQIVLTEPRSTVAAVVVGDGTTAPWTVRLGDTPPAAELLPGGLRLQLQRLEPVEAEAVLQLVAASGSTDTTPAPWWVGAAVEPDPPPDNVTYLGRRFGGWAAHGDDGEEGNEVVVRPADLTSAAGIPDHPTLLLLGPVELQGATGSVPPRAAKQCLEYCAWLLEHPGRTAQAMAAALAVAEGTRRSNVSRLRGWLGEDAAGDAYLPDAYSGRIVLSPAVSSDWQRLQILTAPGVDRSTAEALRAALQLVRGAPLADAAPGQWFWAEELRTDMISCVRDVGVELTSRALEAGDLDLARWAAARALVAAPGDELLLASRIRTEHRAGNAAETERLTLQLAAQARRLGVDLDEQTVVLLQEVMEGRVRARMA